MYKELMRILSTAAALGDAILVLLSVPAAYLMGAIGSGTDILIVVTPVCIPACSAPSTY